MPPEYTAPRVAPVRIGAFAGGLMGVTILPGVTLNEGAVALAHALVTRDLAPWSLNAGSPARKARDRERATLLAMAAEIEAGAPTPAQSC